MIAPARVEIIQTLRPAVSREEALAKLRPAGLPGLLRSALRGPLRRIADAYVPYRLYRVEAEGVPRFGTQYMALDAVQGTLDPYRFEGVPVGPSLVSLETRNRLPRTLEDDRTRELLIASVRRWVYQRGFFRLRRLEIRLELVPLDLHIPYWLAFYGTGERAHIAVLDAVRRQMEGARTRDIFRRWLLT
jgi:hypothetical protein